MIKNYVKLSIAVVRFVEKSPNIQKKWVFEEIFFYQICPACPPAVSAQKLSALKFYSFWHFSHIFLVWEAKKTNRFMLRNMVFSGPQIDHFGQNSHFWSEISAEWGPAARPYPASTSWLVKYLKWPWPWVWPSRSRETGY